MATIFVFVCLSRFCVALLTWSRLFSPFGALTISARAGWVNVNAAAATSAHADVRATAACVGIRLTSLGGPHRGRKTADWRRDAPTHRISDVRTPELDGFIFWWTASS